jgi:small-conductance mechanosensitive channel
VTTYSHCMTRRRWTLLALVLLAAAMLPVIAGAVELKEPAPAIVGAPQMAPVLVDGHELFRVVGVAAYPAKRRAAEIAVRIIDLAQDPAFDSSSVQLADDEGTIVIVADATRIMTVLDQDAALEGLTTRIVAVAMAERIREAIDEYRQERAPGYIVRSVAVIAAVTFAVVALFWSLRWLFGRLLNVLEARYEARLDTLEERSAGAVDADQLWRVIRGLVSGIWWVALLMAISLAADVALQRLPWTRFLSYAFRTLVENPVRKMLSAVVDSIPNLVFLLILFFVVRYVLRMLQALFMGISRRSIKIAALEPDTAMVTYRLIRYGILAFALVVAYPYIPGSGSDAFKGISVFTGVLLSIGASSIVANTVAGYMLIYRKAFSLGDVVRIGEQVGRVADVRQQVSVLMTPKNEQVMIPNSVIVSAEVTNYSARVRAGQLILHSTVSIGYDTPWRQVEAMLLEAADRTPGLLKEPKPFVLKRELADFYVSYEINAYSDSAAKMLKTYSALHENILDVFNENQVQIMSPHFEAQPAEPVLARKE